MSITPGSQFPRAPSRFASRATNHPNVLARAVGCDGIFPNPEDHELTPDEIAGLRHALDWRGIVGRRFSP